MPSLGADMERGRLVRWRFQPGQRLRRGQILVEVETDKGLIDVECFHDAELLEQLAPEGTQVAVGAPIARLRVEGVEGVEGADAALEPTPAPPPAAPERAAPSAPPPVPSPQALPTPTAARDELASPRVLVDGARIVASPLARRRARERGLDLRAIAPGPAGRITAEDVERAVAGTSAGMSTGVSAPAAASAPEETRDPKEAMRRAIAANMARSKREIPHYYLWHTVDVSDAVAWLKKLNDARPVTERILFAALLARAVARAAAAAPELNGSFIDGALRSSSAVHLGFATAQRGGGLIAPAILDAHTLSLDAMMKAIGDLVQRVRAGGLKGREMSAGTLTLSSLGDQGVDGLLPVIQWPQVAIVGAGRVVERPWVVAGTMAVRSTLALTLAGDHRASDGHRGARFLQAIEKNLCTPPLSPESP